MKKNKILKTLATIGSPIAIGMAGWTATSITSHSMNLAAPEPKDLSTWIDAGTNIGTFTSQPTAAQVINMLDIDYAGITHPNDIEVDGAISSTGTLIKGKNNSVYYTTTPVSITFSISSTATHTIKDSLGLTGTETYYDMTLGSEAYYPAASDTVTAADILTRLATHHTGLNINQLNVTLNPWDKNQDCYTVTLAAKTNSNYYVANDSFTIHFNKQRTPLATANFSPLTDFYTSPTDSWEIYRSLKTNYGGTYSGLFANDGSDFIWTDETTNTPSFKLFGNETYTSKTYTVGTPIVVTDTSIGLTIQPSAQSLATVFPCHTNTTNTSLTYTYRNVTIEDIQLSLEEHGGTGQTPVNNVQWGYVTFGTFSYDDTVHTGTIVITAKTDSQLVYTGNITVTFAWTHF